MSFSSVFFFFLVCVTAPNQCSSIETILLWGCQVFNWPNLSLCNLSGDSWPQGTSRSWKNVGTSVPLGTWRGANQTCPQQKFEETLPRFHSWNPILDPNFISNVDREQFSLQALTTAAVFLGLKASSLGIPWFHLDWFAQYKRIAQRVRDTQRCQFVPLDTVMD